MEQHKYDVAVIGGGVIGCAIARELSRYRLSVCLIEKEEDVCSGTSKANSAIIHAGFDAAPGSLKARMNVEGNRLMGELSKQLDFRFRRNGSLVVCLSDAELPVLERLYAQGKANGVPELQIVDREALRQMEPNISEKAVAALYAPTGGIVCPFELTIALAENACENGVEFRMNEEVRTIGKTSAGFMLQTSHGEIQSRYVINAAGVYADRLHNMVSGKKLHITARKGEYCLLDREAGGHVSSTIFQLPGKLGKGVLVTPTVHGNLLLGPTAKDVEDREDTATTAQGLAEVLAKSAQSVKDIPCRTVITSFSGLRAHEQDGDFVLGEASDAPGFFDAAGIESPGLSSAPAIGVFLAKLVAEKAGAERKNDFVSERKGIVRAAELPPEERAALIRENPLYGSIVCRCEQISEGEIVDAIRRTPGAVSMDGIKRRVRAGMGRCQGGFCTPRVMEILARERGVSVQSVCKNVPGSELLARREAEV